MGNTMNATLEHENVSYILSESGKIFIKNGNNFVEIDKFYFELVTGYTTLGGSEFVKVH
jgi:hypothetical protein